MELARLRKQLDELGKADADPRVDAETAIAEAQLRAIQSQLNSIDGQSVRATVEVDDRGSLSRSTGGMRTLTSAAMAVSPALGGIGAAAVAGLGAIAPMAASAAAGLGVLALGFAGVGDAVKLLDQRQEAVAVNAAKGAASQVNSARQVQSAQASLANAQANAASQAINASERVADAERNVAEARQDAADDVARAQDRAAEGVLSALRQQERAERTLSEAQDDARQAQTDLTYARADARRELEDMNAELRNSALDEEQATLNVERAQKRLNEVIASGAEASSLERREADLNYRQAVASLEDLRVRNGRLSDDVRVANARGVDGADQVVAARERVADAEQTVADAARAAGEAAVAVDKARTEGAAEVAKAQRDGAEKIADAQRQVASAVREQANQQRQSAFSIAQAQQAVAAAMETTGTTGVAALAGIDAKLAEVNPSTMAFARFVDEKLQPAFERLKETAAAGLLPGVREGLENLLSQEPRIQRFVATYAGALGDLSRDSLTNLTNPQWQRFFDMLETEGVPQLQSMWRAGDDVAEAFANMLVAFAPMATDMAGGIEDLAERFRAWSQDLSGSHGFHEFESYVRENWPKIREIIANVAETVGAMIQAGAPIAGAYLTGFKLLTEVLAGLPVGVVQALLVAVLAFNTAKSVAGVINGIAGAFGTLTTAAGNVSGGIGRAQGAMGGLMGFLGGPWGLGLAAAGLAVGALSAAMAAQEEQTQKWTEVLKGGGRAAIQLRQDAEASLNAGFWSRTWADLNGTNDAYRQAITNTGEYWRSLTPLQQATQKQSEWTAELNRRLHDENATTAEVEAAKRRYAYWTGEVTTQQGELTGATDLANGAIAGQGAAYANLTGAASQQLGIYNQLLQDKATAEANSAAATGQSLGGASGSWQSHVGNVNVSLQEYAAALDEDVRKKDAWRQNVKSVTERGGVEVGAALLAMGEEGARIARDRPRLVGASGMYASPPVSGSAHTRHAPGEAICASCRSTSAPSAAKKPVVLRFGPPGAWIVTFGRPMPVRIGLIPSASAMP